MRRISRRGIRKNRRHHNHKKQLGFLEAVRLFLGMPIGF